MWKTHFKRLHLYLCQSSKDACNITGSERQRSHTAELDYSISCKTCSMQVRIASGKCYKHQLLKKKGCIYLVRNRGNLRHYAAWRVHRWWICQGCRLAMLTVFRRTVCRWWSFWNIKHTKMQLSDSASFYITFHLVIIWQTWSTISAMYKERCLSTVTHQTCLERCHF